MSQDKSCMVGALGLLEHENRLIKSILRHANERNTSRYAWADDLDEAHVVIVSADNAQAMKAWQAIANNQQPPVLLLITSKLEEADSAEYVFSRPFAPLKMVAILDRVLGEKLSTKLEKKLFEGENKTASTENMFAQGIASLTRRMLVVDDSPTVRKQLESELVSLKFKVDMAETGEQCIEMLEKASYDVIFLDVVLPGMDGYEVCKKIKKNLQTKNTTVIMLTSKTSSFDRVRGVMAGCDSYLTKPVEYEKFHKILEQYLTDA